MIRIPTKQVEVYDVDQARREIWLFLVNTEWSIGGFAKAIGVHKSNFSSFLSGRRGLADKWIERAYKLMSEENQTNE